MVFWFTSFRFHLTSKPIFSPLCYHSFAHCSRFLDPICQILVLSLSLSLAPSVSRSLSVVATTEHRRVYFSSMLLMYAFECLYFIYILIAGHLHPIRLHLGAETKRKGAKGRQKTSKWMRWPFGFYVIQVILTHHFKMRFLPSIRLKF